MSGELSKYILTTIVYYDVMDYPLTAFEVWKYLTRISSESESVEKFSLAEVLEGLEDEKLQKFIEEHQGYYFFRGRKNLVAQRIERNKISEYKFRIVRRVVWWLRFVPFVHGVAVAGRLAMKNAQAKSDLDLFIILQDGNIFTGRLLVTVLVHIFGKRRYGNKVQNRICLNHFVTNEFAVSVKDIFSAHEYSFLVPVFNGDSWMEFQKNNDWIKKYKINFEASTNNLKLVPDSKYSQWVRKTLEKLLQFDWVEIFLGNWQRQRINNNPKTKQFGSVILAEDSELAFWPNFENQGPKVFEKFQEKLAELK
jgi:hypothetical protein